MAYVICEPCVDTKNAACIEVCPVDAIHPLPEETDFSVVNQLFIDPQACTHCGHCALACPVNAIYAEIAVPPAWDAYIALNAAYFGQ